MRPVRKKRLQLVVLLIFGAAVVIGLVLFALRQNINLFLPHHRLQGVKLRLVSRYVLEVWS